MNKFLQSIIIGTLLTSCNPQFNTLEYQVLSNPKIMVLSENDMIRECSKHNVKYKFNGGNGFYVPKENTLYVPYGANNDGLPDFTILGHELWHLRELGGKYHE